MTAPFPAMVDGPVHTVPNVHISAGNARPDALVTVSQNGSEAAQTASASPGMIWFGRRGPGARRPPVQRQSPLNVSQCLNYRFTPEKPGGCNGTNRHPSSY